MLINQTVLILACCMVTGIVCSNDLILSDVAVDESDATVSLNNEKLETFIPTHEWQVVHDNQAVPAGLHIRMNFQTGVKEAKILDPNEENQNEKEEPAVEKTKVEEKIKTPKIIMSEETKPIEEFAKVDDKIYFTKSHLKEALHEFRDKVGIKDAEDVWKLEDLKKVVPHQQVKKKFRSIEEIRSELEHTMGWKIKSDMEIMKDHIFLLQNESQSDEVKGVTLDNLEYYVHQIDNGKDLVRMGRLTPIIMMLNDTNEILQEKAANVIGAAAQSNQDVQDNVVHNNGLEYLLQMLYDGKLMLTKKKGLYALSAVVRGNRGAQKELVKLNGLERILHVIKAEINTPLKVKAVTLLFDLIVEQNEVLQTLVEKGEKKADEISPLLNLLLDNGWCELLPPLLLKDDYDTIEKVLQAIIVSRDQCKKIFKGEVILKTFNDVMQRMSNEILTEDDADFKSYLVNLKEQLVNDVIEKLNQ